MVLLRIFSHRFHRIHRTSCCVYSPTDFTDLHRWFGCVYSPTDFTDLHRWLGCLQGGALVSSAPTEQNRYSPTESTELTELLAERILPQISLHRWLGCLQGGALVSSAPTEQEVHQPKISSFCVDLCNLWENHCLLGWCTSCSGKRQSRAETSAPPEISSFCEFCAICGRSSQAEASVNSVKSVGDPLFA